MKVSSTSYLLLLILAIFWGSSFILMKEGLKYLSNFQLAALRISMAGVVLMPFIRKRHLRIKRKDWKFFFISGLLGNAIPAFLFATAQLKISSSLSGALNSLTPLFVLLIGIFFLGVPFNRYKAWGVIIGLSGALMLLLNKGMEISSEDLRYSTLIIIGTVCYGTNVNIIKYRLNAYAPFTVAAIPLGIMAIFTLIILFFTGLPVGTDQVQLFKSYGAIGILAIVGTAFSLVLFNRLIQQTNAVFASSVTYLIPIVALLWGFMDGEQISVVQVSGLIIVLFAIRIINKS